MIDLASPPTASLTHTRTTWWNTFHSLTVICGAGWILWAAVIIGRLSGDGEPVPRALNAIALTGLSCGALLSFVAASNVNRRTRDAEWQTAVTDELERLRLEYQRVVRDEIAAQLTKPLGEAAAGIARLNDRIGMRHDDDPTVPLAGRINGHRTIYAASASVATVQIDGVLDTIRERVDQRVDEAIGAKVQEFGAQRWYAGYAAGREDDGSVVALQPRNGHRSTS